MTGSTAQDMLHSIRTQVMWNRLISVVEEQAMTLLRTAFSTSVREAGAHLPCASQARMEALWKASMPSTSSVGSASA